jgi:hypothetical protein
MVIKVALGGGAVGMRRRMCVGGEARRVGTDTRFYLESILVH